MCARAETGDLHYWVWVRTGSGGRPGYAYILNRYLALHLIVGGLLTLVVPVTLKDAASTVLLPLAGALVGAALAWAGSAYAILQAREIAQLAKHAPGGLANYVFLYVTAMFVIFVSLLLWGVAGLGIFEQLFPYATLGLAYEAARVLLYTISSLALRECWHLVYSVQIMLLAQIRIREAGSSAHAVQPEAVDPVAADRVRPL